MQEALFIVSRWIIWNEHRKFRNRKYRSNITTHSMIYSSVIEASGKLFILYSTYDILNNIVILLPLLQFMPLYYIILRIKLKLF